MSKFNFHKQFETILKTLIPFEDFLQKEATVEKQRKAQPLVRKLYKYVEDLENQNQALKAALIDIGHFENIESVKHRIDETTHRLINKLAT